VTRGGGVDCVRRSCNARQIRPRRRDLDDSARLLSARQAFLIDGDIAEARACAYPHRNDTVYIGSKGSREDAIDIELHALHGTPAGAERSEGGSCVLVDDLVGHTQESLSSAHRRASQDRSFRRAVKGDWHGRRMDIQRSQVNKAVALDVLNRGNGRHARRLWRLDSDKCRDALLADRLILRLD
jgi:hypothetical protein